MSVLGRAFEALCYSGDDWESCDLLFPFSTWRKLLHHSVCSAGGYF